jgi:hypothetical protein
VDALRPRETTRRANHPRGRDDDVERHVVRRHRNVVLHDLEVVHRGDDRRGVVDGAEAAGQRVLEVAVAATLAQPRALSSDSHAAGDHEVDPSELARLDRLAQGGCAPDRRRLGEARPEAARFELQEAPGRAQAGHRHEHELALAQRAQADGALRSVGVALDPPRGVPLGQRGEPVGGLASAGEVRDAILKR